MQCAKFAVLQTVEADNAALCIHLLSLYVYAIALAVLCAGVAVLAGVTVYAYLEEGFTPDKSQQCSYRADCVAVESAVSCAEEDECYECYCAIDE